MEEQKKEINWMEVELKNLEGNTGGNFERLPSLALKLEENKVNVITLDASKQWEKWTDNTPNQPPKVKVVIPCVFKGEKCNWWVNTKNPILKSLYSECIKAKDKNAVVVKVMQTGSKKDTKYILVTE